ncbi:MAG: YdcH family protein [Myxococcota bacterium]
MARQRRSSTPELQLERLQKKHASIDARVEELSGRSFLTVSEQMEQRRLKKQKLAMKDQMQRFGSS